MKKVTLFVAMILSCAAPAGAAVTTRTATVDVEAALMSSIQPGFYVMLTHTLDPPVDIFPGDTLELQVTFQNAQRLSVQAAPSPDPPPALQEEICSPNFYMSYPYPPSGTATLETTFAGVSGSLFVNPSLQVDDCYGGD